jgi:hypothetical protein
MNLIHELRDLHSIMSRLPSKVLIKMIRLLQQITKHYNKLSVLRRTQRRDGTFAKNLVNETTLFAEAIATLMEG